MTADLIVIGGGFAGILEALRAAESGGSVVLLEQTDQLGGAIRAAQVDGQAVDVGAESFSVVSDEFRSLLEHWGLGDDIVSPEPVGASIISPAGRFAVPHGVMGVPAGAEALRRSGALNSAEVEAALELDLSPFAAERHASVADLVRRRLGDAVYRRLVEPVVTGVYGTSAEQLDANVVMPELVRRAQQTGSLLEASRQLRGDGPSAGLAVQSLRGGLHTLVPRMVDVLTAAGVRIELNSPVTRISRRQGQWSVVANGDWTAPRVCLAVGPAQTVQLLATAEVSAGPSVVAQPVPGTVAVASVQSTVLDDHPWGSGALIADEVAAEAKAFTHINAKWAWWSDALPPGRHLVRISLREPGGRPDIIRGAVERTLTEVMGVEPGAVRGLAIQHWPDVQSRPAPGAKGEQRALADQLRADGLVLSGSSIPGSGLLRLAREITTTRQQKEDYVPVG